MIKVPALAGRAGTKSGSECVAAKKEQVNFIGYELNPEYVELCNQRLDEI